MLSYIRQRKNTSWLLLRHVPWILKERFQNGRPNILAYFGEAPGDDLLCTTVLHELAARGENRIWMMSRYPELFKDNGDVQRVVPVDFRFKEFTQIFGGRWQFLEYARYDRSSDRSIPPKTHIIAELCKRAGITGKIILKPHIFLSSDETKVFGQRKHTIAIQSSGLASKYPMRNKQWFPERFQEIVDRMGKRTQFIQVGSVDDPKLDGVIDARGKTTIRETASLLSNCRLYVGNVGFLMHLARAVECPSVIVYGGREAPWQSGYSCNINLYSQVHCAPCWLWNKCDFEMTCMKEITVDNVIDAIDALSFRPKSPLAVDVTLV